MNNKAGSLLRSINKDILRLSFWISWSRALGRLAASRMIYSERVLRLLAPILLWRVLAAW